MIKVYFDWNVMSQMKNGFHIELSEITFDNDKLFKPFSSSHIGDIFSSYNENQDQIDIINSDLEFISKLTGDKCLINNGKDVVLEFYSPKELFQQRIEEKELFGDLSLDGLLKIFEENELTKEIGKTFVNLLKSMPIDDSLKQAFEDPNSAEQIGKIFPGLKDNPTIEGFFNSFSQSNIGLNEFEDYKELRKIVQSGIGINRDRIYDSKNPFQVIDKESLVGN